MDARELADGRVLGDGRCGRCGLVLLAGALVLVMLCGGAAAVAADGSAWAGMMVKASAGRLRRGRSAMSWWPVGRVRRGRSRAKGGARRSRDRRQQCALDLSPDSVGRTGCAP